MSQIAASYCAGMVERLRRRVRQKFDPKKHWEDELDALREDVGELCDQLVMKLEPIEVVRPKP